MYKSQYMTVPFLIADPDAAATQDAQVIIQIIKGVVFHRRYSPVSDREFHLLQVQVIYQILKFTIPVTGTEITSGNGPCFSGTVHEIRTFPVVLANEAGIGMF